MKDKKIIKNYEIVSLFPQSFLYVSNIEIDNIEIFKYLKNIDYTKNTLNKNSSCYMSKNKNIFKDIKLLKKEINKHVENYLLNIFKYKMDYKFLNSWATKTKNLGFSQKHYHANTFLSGVYYPYANNDFKINFYKSGTPFWNIEVKEYNHFNLKDIQVTINKDNTLLLFPSDLEHSVELNESKIDRYSVAFNINPKGFIGTEDTKVYF